MRRYANILLLGAITLFFGAAVEVWFYKTDTHRDLAEGSLRLLDSDKHREVIAHRDQLLTAVVEEDRVPRFSQHFYDPETQFGLPRNWYTRLLDALRLARIGWGPYVDRMGEGTYADIKPDPPSDTRYMSALEWGRNGMPDDMDWEGAIWSYDYTPSAKARAYQALGHVLHLLQDMGQPDHTRGRPHPDHHLIEEIYAQIDPRRRGWVGYEALWKHHAGTWPPGRQPEEVTSLQDALDRMARESQVAEDALGLPCTDAGCEPRESALGLQPLQLRDPIQRRIVARLLDRKFEDNLYTKYELEVPLGPTIPLAPTTQAERDRLDRYLELGHRLLPRIEEFGAGLMIHFYRVVNPPPYVESVEIWQEEELRYAGRWEDEQEWDDTYQVSRVVRRELVTERDEPLQMGVPAEVRIAFGPHEMEPTSGRIRRKPVAVEHVRVEQQDGTEIQVQFTAGAPEQGGFWQGIFVPTQAGKVVIEAEDLGEHLEGREPLGSELDADPATPARPLVLNPGQPATEPIEYGWEGYENPGADRNHRVRIEGGCVLGEDLEVATGETAYGIWEGQIEYTELGTLSLAHGFRLSEEEGRVTVTQRGKMQCKQEGVPSWEIGPGGKGQYDIKKIWRSWEWIRFPIEGRVVEEEATYTGDLARVTGNGNSENCMYYGSMVLPLELYDQEIVGGPRRTFGWTQESHECAGSGLSGEGSTDPAAAAVGEMVQRWEITLASLTEPPHVPLLRKAMREQCASLRVDMARDLRVLETQLDVWWLSWDEENYEEELDRLRALIVKCRDSRP